MDDKELKDLNERLEKEAEAARLKFPIEISGLDWNVSIGVKKTALFSRGEAPPGSFVAIQSCKESHGDKTYLGLLIGYVPTDVFAQHDPVTKRLRINVLGDNPAIFVFDLGEVVLGCESWWGPIENEEHLKQITKSDIENVWYMKALRQLLAQDNQKDNKKEKSP